MRTMLGVALAALAALGCATGGAAGRVKDEGATEVAASARSGARVVVGSGVVASGRFRAEVRVVAR